MFCTSLRRRRSFSAVVPQLIAPPLKLRESQLGTHDLEISISSNVDPTTGNTHARRHLRVILLSASATTETQISDTFKRIHHFASLTGGQDLAIVFLLEPPPNSSFVSAKALASESNSEDSKADALRAYSKLQAEMINRAEIPHVPILPLSRLDGLSQLLQKHATALTRAAPMPKASATSFELLQLCTANPPMSQQTAYVLTDLFRNLSDLATACSSVSSAPNSSSPSARAAGVSSQLTGTDSFNHGIITQSSDADVNGKLKRLRDLVGDQECRNIVEFWKGEWTVD